MEENYIWNGDTYFYINVKKKAFGCRINRNESSEAKEIIKYFKTTRKKQIEAWRKEWKLTTEDFVATLREYLKEKRNVNKNTYKKLYVYLLRR